MDTLVILLLFQFAGTALCTVFFCIADMRESKTIYISNREVKWNNSQPWPWLEEYFQLHEESSLRSIFPESYKVAMATKRYIELNGTVRLSSRRYQKRLKRILNLVDISREIGIEKKKAHDADH